MTDIKSGKRRVVCVSGRPFYGEEDDDDDEKNTSEKEPPADALTAKFLKSRQMLLS